LFDLQSVTGLLISLIPDIIAANKKVTINTPRDELTEIMHGIGLRSSSHQKKPGSYGEKEVHGRCASAIKYAKTQRAVSH
jgi:hypothetical protein